MKKSYDINQKIDATLKSIEGIGAVEPKAFFYTRLHARMQKEMLKPNAILGFRLKPIYAYSVVLVLLVINIIAISTFKKQTQNNSKEQFYSLYETE